MHSRLCLSPSRITPWRERREESGSTRPPLERFESICGGGPSTSITADNGDKVNEVMLAGGLPLMLSQQIEARYSIKTQKDNRLSRTNGITRDDL
jgi:hypothetical protein